ncbi:MAG: hypothetical protein A2Y25_02495 [Candidatus Melainabacteria bacterium GWF2_37_15]|nr:MAG: hypothetical protein A2Y25_02495 [Candidatus Melainabacteria bacterium GWF2_37_15]
MSNIKSFAERSRDFEEAHHSCRELMAAPLNKIENYVTKWLIAAIGAVILIQAVGFTYLYYELMHLRKKVDHRYFLIEESLEDIHHVKIENGKVVRNYTKE